MFSRGERKQYWMETEITHSIYYLKENYSSSELLFIGRAFGLLYIERYQCLEILQKCWTIDVLHSIMNTYREKFQLFFYSYYIKGRYTSATSMRRLNDSGSLMEWQASKNFLGPVRLFLFKIFGSFQFISWPDLSIC